MKNWKNWLRLLGVIALAMVIGFSLIACSTGGDDDDDKDKDGDKVTEGAEDKDKDGDGDKDKEKEPKKVDLGDFEDTNEDGTQGRWYSNGQDNKVTTLTIEDLIAAKYLVIEFTTVPSGTLQLIWQGDGKEPSDWNQEDITTNMGKELPAKGTSFDGNKLTIELSKALKGYDDFVKSTQAKIILGYYSTTLDDLGIKEAYLLIYE